MFNLSEVTQKGKGRNSKGAQEIRHTTHLTLVTLTLNSSSALEATVYTQLTRSAANAYDPPKSPRCRAAARETKSACTGYRQGLGSALT